MDICEYDGCENRNISPDGRSCMVHWLEYLPLSILGFFVRPVVGLLGGAIWTLGFGGAVTWAGLIVGTIATVITHHAVHFGDELKTGSSYPNEETKGLEALLWGEVMPILISISIGLVIAVSIGDERELVRYLLATLGAIFTHDLLMAHSRRRCF
jgi:hypothetical protein